MKTLMIAMGMMAVNAAQAETTMNVVCAANEVFVIGTGKTEAITTFKFTPTKNGDLYVLKNLKGKIIFPEYGEKTISGSGAQGGIDIGNLIDESYDLKSVKSNPKYRPTKYKGMIQFPNLRADFDAMMPGAGLNYVDLLLPKEAFAKTDQHFQAHLIIGMDQNGAKMTLDCGSRVKK